MDSLVAQKVKSLPAMWVKSLPAMWGIWVWSLGQKDPLEGETATYSNTLAWKIPRPEEPGKLQSTDCKESNNWAPSLHLVFLIENSKYKHM